MAKKSLLLLCIFCLAIIKLMAQEPISNSNPDKPKLVIGLVIDQMRWDYLYRFNSLYGNGGFKRLISQGNSCENTFISHLPTYTAVGHSCIYTGSIPAFSGIVGNNWFDRITNRNVYCTDDSTVSGVGANTAEGQMSPQNLWVTTITDELRLSNNFKSKVIGIALKDRGGILPAGHTANAAYWYEDTLGKWISSSYYMKELPSWVNNFNQNDEAGKYMSKDWNTMLPISKYDLSTADNMPYEARIPGERFPGFPHKLSGITSPKYYAFKFTPFAATYTFDFAKAAIEYEKLGSSTVTDFLAVSISSTDYMGHTFGPNSIEAEDTYLRLDKDIESFLNYLDNKLGKGNYIIFLTADHGAAHVPGFLKSQQVPAGVFSEWDLMAEVNIAMQKEFGITNAVMNLQNYQLYMNMAEIEKQGKDFQGIKNAAIRFLLTKPYIINAFEMSKITETGIPEPLKSRLINSYNLKRSGDIQFIIKPAYFDGGITGTTHGLWNPYDSHIPLVWYGWGIRPGKTFRETYMTDITATLASLLQVQMPNGCVGKAITEVMK